VPPGRDDSPSGNAEGRIPCQGCPLEASAGNRRVTGARRCSCSVPRRLFSLAQAMIERAGSMTPSAQAARSKPARHGAAHRDRLASRRPWRSCHRKFGNSSSRPGEGPVGAAGSAVLPIPACCGQPERVSCNARHRRLEAPPRRQDAVNGVIRSPNDRHSIAATMPDHVGDCVRADARTRVNAECPARAGRSIASLPLRHPHPPKGAVAGTETRVPRSSGSICRRQRSSAWRGRSAASAFPG